MTALLVDMTVRSATPEVNTIHTDTRTDSAWPTRARGGPDHPLVRVVTHRGSPGARWRSQHDRSHERHDARSLFVIQHLCDSRRGARMTSSKDGALELRLVVPHELLAGSPRVEMISQLNAAVVGLGKRQFLELLRRQDAPLTLKVGKLRLVRRDDLLAFLERIGAANDTHSKGFDDADKVLAELGCNVRPKGR